MFFGDDESTEVDDEKNKLSQKVETLEGNIVSSKEVLTGDTVHGSNGEDQMEAIDM